MHKTYAFPFMKDPALLAVVQALQFDVRYVGGVVRNALAGAPLTDIDLATPLVPTRVIERLEAAGLKAVPTGLAHGTITAVSDHQSFEITTLRRDVKSHGRHADVAYTDDWQQDAARRDFTINAMSLSPEGELFDYFNGVDDLAAGRVRFVGTPERRIREDVLRILRFFRFSAYYARSIDREGLAACTELAPLLPTLSAERVRGELLKLLLAPQPEPVVRLMQEAHIFTELKLPLRHHAALQKLVEQEQQFDAPCALRRLCTLMEPQASPAEVAARLRLSRSETNRLVAMCDEPLEDIRPATLNRLAYMHGRESVRDRLLLQGRATADAMHYLEFWTRPVFPLTGRDLLAVGLTPGPEVGALLKKVEAWWICEDFRPDQAACLARLLKSRA